MPTIAQRLETATTTLEGLVANTTGTGDMVLKTSPVLVTPTIGVASATSITVATYINAATVNAATFAGTTIVLESDGGFSQGGFSLTLGGNISFGAMGRTLVGTADAAAARAAIGAGTSSFDPASPGAIGTTTPAAASITAAYMGDSAYRYVIVSNTPYFTGQNHVQFDSTKISGKDASGNEKFSLTYGTGAAVFTTLSIGANAIAIGGTITFSGAYAGTFTLTGTTNLTLPTAGTLATLAGAETLSNKTLVAPALGTPASGNLANCTGLPIGGGGTGATTVAAANAALREEFTEYTFNAADMSATASGTGYTGLDSVRNEASSFTSTAGVGNAHASFGTFVSRGLPFSGFAISAVPFSKRIEFSGTTTFLTSYLGDANSTSRVYIGGRTLPGAGTVTSRAIGWKKVGGSANVFLSVHNGTTETTVDTGFAPTTDTAFSWRITSDGAGNVVMFINGTQVATTSAGPSTTGTGGTPPFQSIEGVAGNATRQAIITNAYRIRIYA